MLSIKRFFTLENCIAFLLALTVFIIPIEHKYDKPLRFFSLTLIPDGLSIPASFDKKIYFYPSDFIAILLLSLTIFHLRVPIRKLLFDGKGGLLLLILGCTLLSAANSPFSQYPLIYIRCFQLLTPFIFFTVLAVAFSIDQQKKIGHLILGALIAAALFQSSVAIAQYLHQGSIGLRLLSEIPFQPCVDIPHIKIPNGSRWIFDPLFSRVALTNVVIRTPGTLFHANVLGGFLCFSLLATSYFFLKNSKRGRFQSCFLAFAIFIQSFTLCMTYSRSAIFALMISLSSWALLHFFYHPKIPKMRSLAVVITVSFFICAAIFSEQYMHRGGVVNSSALSKGSDKIRIFYQDIALRMILDHPLTGVGYQLFSLHAPLYEKPNPIYETSVHNIYLLLSSETGLISLSLFLFWVGAILISFFKSKKDPLSISLFSIFVGILFIGLCDFYPLASHQGIILFFIIGGLSYGYTQKSKQEQRSASYENVRPNFSDV